MKKNQNIISAFFAITLLVFLTGCASNVEESATEAVSDVAVTYTETVAEGAEKFVANMSIGGMACEMMCGSKISSTLAEIEGVESADIEFNGIDEDNFALVEYDGTKISEQNLITAIQGLADGHYQVKSVEVTHFIPGDVVEEDEEKVSLYKPSLEYKMPNVFSAFVRLF